MNLIYSKKKEILQELFVPSTLEISIPESLEHQHVKLNGEFPRRVQQYERLAEFNGFYINSPLSGIAYLKENTNSEFLLKVSGRNEIYNLQKGQKDKAIIDINETKDWLQFLNEKGLYSFEYKKSLYHLLTNQDNIKQIYFLLYDPYIPHFWHDLFQHYREELIHLKRWFNQFFPHFHIHFIPNLQDFFKNKQMDLKNQYQYHFKYVQFVHQKKNIKSYILSPSTLFSLLRALFYGEPFTKGIFVLNDYTKDKIFIGFYYHGSNLVDIYRQYSYLINLSKKNKIYLSEHFYFNIYIDYYYYYKEHAKKNVCTGCFICNHYCPVHANPMSLFEKKDYFKKDSCINCGLCDEVCESNLNMMDRIRHAIGF